VSVTTTQLLCAHPKSYWAWWDSTVMAWQHPATVLRISVVMIQVKYYATAVRTSNVLLDMVG
jgi:hypothetical protein